MNEDHVDTDRFASQIAELSLHTLILPALSFGYANFKSEITMAVVKL